jgi:hypothetical protein
VAVACLRCLARLVPRLPPPLLLGELGRGRLMEGLRRAFLSTSTDTRRSVVAVLVEMHLLLRGTGAFARYAGEQALEPPPSALRDAPLATNSLPHLRTRLSRSRQRTLSRDS